MAEKSFFKRNWKLLLNIFTLAALAILAYLIRDQIVDTFNNLKSINLWVVSLLIPLLLLNYHSQTKMYLGIFKLLGNGFKYGEMIRAAIEINFVNRVFPSGGVSGISYFGLRMRSATVTGGKATMVQLMRFILLFTSFEILLILGLIMLAVGGHVNNMVILVASSLTTLLVVGTIAFIMIVGSEKRIKATFGAITRIVNWVIHVVRRGKPETFRIARAEQMVKELHNNFELIAKHYTSLRGPFLWAMVVSLAEVMSIYVIFVAFGEWVNLGAVILAYAVANFAGLIAILPGGIGVYEALMTGVFAAAGIPARLSLPVTVMFRVLSTILQVIPGYYFYHKTVRGLRTSGDKPAKEHSKHSES